MSGAREAVDPYCPDHGTLPTAYSECSCRARAALDDVTAPDPREAALQCSRCLYESKGLGSSDRCICGPNVPCGWCGQNAARALAEQDTTDPAVGLSEDELAYWLGAMDEARNHFDITDEATTVITIDVETLAARLAAHLRSARGYRWPQDEAWYAADVLPPCGWCHQPWSATPAFDCKNPMHTGSAAIAAANPPADP